MLLWSYLATFATSPGFVPADWQPFAADEEQPLTEEEVHYLADSLTAELREREDGYEWHLLRPRYCKNCHAWKPPRAHHCSVTQRCVLKMDHW